MSETEHLLTCLMEECNEVSQRVSKALRFGLDEKQEGQEKNNRERIIEEFYDLLGVVNLLLTRKILDFIDEEAEDKIPKKAEKVKKYMEYAKQKGTING